MATERVLSNLNLISFKTEGGLQNHIDELQDGDLVFTPDNSLKGVLFDFKWADHLLNDMSWLRADTFSWHDGEMYKAAYNHLVADFEGTVAETTTIDGIEITYYLADDKHVICLPDQEDKILELYNKTGVAWYYILDTINKQFKLPRTKFGFTGLRDEVGGYVEAGIPNLKGKLVCNNLKAESGDFFENGTSSNWYGDNIHTNVNNSVLYDASNVSPVYNDSDTVQPPATQMYLYFYVGNFERDAVEQTAGVTTEMLNSKADVDLSNMNASQSAKDTIVGWGIPDYSAGVDITWTNETKNITIPSGTVVSSQAYFIAPSDGMVVLHASVSNGAEIVFVNENIVESPSTNVWVNTRFPVSKGDEIRVAIVARYYNCQFFPFKGVN